MGALYWVSVRFARAVHGSRAGAAEEPGRAERARLAVWLLFLFVIVGSLLGYDLVMSLDPHWFSGLLGGYVVVGMLYSGFAFLVLLTGLYSFGRPGWVMPPKEMQDLAKLVFATSVLWMYFFWSQYLVIWYGNVPIETRYVLARFFADPWRCLAVVRLLHRLGDPVLVPPRPPHRAPAGGAPGPGGDLLPVPDRDLPRADRPGAAVDAPARDRLLRAADVLLALLMTLGFGALFVLSFRIFVPRFGLAPRGEA